MQARAATMLRLAQAGLAPVAVARRGLNEGLGLTAFPTTFEPLLLRMEEGFARKS